MRTLAPTLLKLAGYLVLAAAAVWGLTRARNWALTSPTFTLQKLTVEGASRVSPGELARLGGITPGLNLFALDVDALERALATHPWVRRVVATRHLPSGLAIHVDEHEPAALLAMGDLYLLNAEGTPFKRLQRGDAVDLPLVTGVERDAYVADPEATSARLREALAVMDAYADAGLAKAGRLSEVRLEADGTVLVTGAGQEVRLPQGNVTPHLHRLALVRAELARRRMGAEVIHLDNRARPGWVAVKVSASASGRSGALAQHESAPSRE
ncbi:MAG: FtsQ-type POTRA domain-containing protein [Myxococcaceae bacterium]|nr:FtsQ-type POTRA domain-containing protein [Myxococcaceae bacterium]MCI0671943.1 FtsQ-type POTRA domain-containing protein [Myxococcaceae bacterium]